MLICLGVYTSYSQSNIPPQVENVHVDWINHNTQLLMQTFMNKPLPSGTPGMFELKPVVIVDTIHFNGDIMRFTKHRDAVGLYRTPSLLGDLLNSTEKYKVQTFEHKNDNVYEPNAISLWSFWGKDYITFDALAYKKDIKTLFFVSSAIDLGTSFNWALLFNSVILFVCGIASILMWHESARFGSFDAIEDSITSTYVFLGCVTFIAFLSIIVRLDGYLSGKILWLISLFIICWWAAIKTQIRFFNYAGPKIIINALLLIGLSTYMNVVYANNTIKGLVVSGCSFLVGIVIIYCIGLGLYVKSLIQKNKQTA